MPRVNSPWSVKKKDGTSPDAIEPGRAPSVPAYLTFEQHANNPLLVFIVLSCLMHVLLLVWLHPLVVTRARRSQTVQVLHVQVRTIPAPQLHPHIRRRYVRRPTPHSSKQPNSSAVSPRQPMPDKRAAQIVDEALKAAPHINQKLEAEQAEPGHAFVFDPILRAQLEKARRKQSHYDALMQTLAQHPEIKVIGKSADFLEIRVHGRCWKVPLSYAYDPFDPSITMQDSNCPKQKFKLLGKHPEPDLH